MEKKIDWKNAKFSPKNLKDGKNDEQIASAFFNYCKEHLSEVEEQLTTQDYDKTLAWLDSFGISDIAIANRIFTNCRDTLSAYKNKQEVSLEPSAKAEDVFLQNGDSLPEEAQPANPDELKEMVEPKVSEPDQASSETKPKKSNSEIMSEFKKLEEDILGRRL